MRLAADLSVIIPARNEMFLGQTIENVLKNMRGDTEIIAILDGAWPLEPIPDHPRVRLVYHPVSIGQRAATNEGARLSQAKYIMKLDAHCAVDEGFDVKLMADCEYDWTVIPRMYNLHAFDWLCADCGWRRYQSPTPEKCEECGSTKVSRDIIWQPRWSRKTDFARFDKTMHFQYWGSFKDHPNAQGDIADTMTSVGACFFMHRQRFWDLGGLDEAHGSWGQFGVEVACKAWLSGGRHVVNKKTWFSHMFRTQGGDFGFPYPLSGRQVDTARKYSRDLWMNNKWPLAKHDLNWLLQRFYPVPDWHDGADAGTVEIPPPPPQPQPKTIVSSAPIVANPKKGILYTTDNLLDGTDIGSAVQHRLLEMDLPILSVSLKPIRFGKNVTVQRDRGHETWMRQILTGLEMMDCDVVYICDHDVLYHASHFTFNPPTRDTFYYNTNVWKVSAANGHAIHYDTKQVSGLVAYRSALLDHYRARIARIDRDGFDLRAGFEPGSQKPYARFDSRVMETFASEFPNVDIRHEHNMVATRWSRDQFKDKRNCPNWQEGDSVPGWGKTEGRFLMWLEDIASGAD
jgi:glycosyltransferase involved in cell wall biosynthesis